MARGAAHLQWIWGQFTSLLSRPVNGTSLAVFRFFVGIVMSLEAYALCVPNPHAIATGRSPLETYFTGPDITFHFPYPIVEWLPLLAAPFIYLIVGLLGLAGLTMAIGLWYRLSAATVFVTWCYLWLVESTRSYWQSHYYLEVLLTFLLIWMPAARRYSLDAWLNRRRTQPATVPFWTIFLLRGQLVIAYFYAGVSKLNVDWLLDAVPVRWFLADAEVTRPYEPFLTERQLALLRSVLQSAEMAYFISYAGVLFDLSIGFLLLVRRTRIFGILLMLIFHATNHFVIFDDIGWFPLVGIMTALIFFDADWPERLARWIRRPRFAPPDWGWFAGGAIMLPVLGGALGWRLPSTAPARTNHPPEKARRVAPWIVVWLAAQALLPIRHYFIPGDGRFTYEGMSFSWRLKAEIRHGNPHQLFIVDSEILSRNNATRGVNIDWNYWQGERVIYRTVRPGQIDWPELPETVIVLDPFVGERIIYNPYCRYAGPPRNEEQARRRAASIWSDVYGRSPPLVATAPLFDVLAPLAEELRTAGGSRPEAAELARLLEHAAAIGFDDWQPLPSNIRLQAAELLERLAANPATGSLVRSHLRRMPPFALDGGRRLPLPFLCIDDDELLRISDRGYMHVDRSAWKLGGSPREPLHIYLAPIDYDTWHMLPQAFISEAVDSPSRGPLICWNSGKDLTISKLLHTSTQPFYLRRYARLVADRWEGRYGRRPAVYALTSLSLNGRPPQRLVDPQADLASVTAKWLAHNEWIRDLEMPRVPPAALDSSPYDR